MAARPPTSRLPPASARRFSQSPAPRRWNPTFSATPRHGRESDGFQGRASGFQAMCVSANRAGAIRVGWLAHLTAVPIHRVVRFDCPTCFANLRNLSKTHPPSAPSPNCPAPDSAAATPARPNATPPTRRRQTARHRQATMRQFARLPFSDDLTAGKPHG